MPVLTNVRHELFAQEVAKGSSLQDAYKQAGFKPNRHNAAKLNTEQHIQERVNELLREAALNTGVTIERVTAELANIAFLDLREAADWGVREVPLRKPVGRVKTVHESYLDLKPAKALPDRVARAIASVRKTKDGVEIKPYDKLSALIRLGQQLGMFKDDKDKDKKGADALIDMIVEAHKRSQGDTAKVIEGESS